MTLETWKINVSEMVAETSVLPVKTTRARAELAI